MEQIDQLLNGYKIIQDPQRFQFGIDAVLLADFALAGTGFKDSVIDLGTGTGIIPLLMQGQRKACSFTGLEIQSGSAEMAARSVELNCLQERIRIVEGDVKKVSELFPKHSFNAVTSNPPYMINEHGHQNPGDAKAIARHEVLCTLEDVVAAADYLLLPHGKFFMIHRPFRLSEIFVILTKYKLEPKRMRLVLPHADEEPNLVLIEAVKGARPRITVEKPLIVRNSNGSYTEEIDLIYGRNNIK